jgi:hypothetical protein
MTAAPSWQVWRYSGASIAFQTHFAAVEAKGVPVDRCRQTINPAEHGPPIDDERDHACNRKEHKRGLQSVERGESASASARKILRDRSRGAAPALTFFRQDRATAAVWCVRETMTDLTPELIARGHLPIRSAWPNAAALRCKCARFGKS